jgi:predicted Zn-dependent protease
VASAGGYLGWQRLQGQMARTDALRLVEQGRFAEAEPLLQAAHDRNPDDVEILRALARSRIFARQPEEALAYLNRWIELRPDDAGALNHRITVRLEMNRLPEVVEDARRVLQLEPDRADLRQSLVTWLVKVGSFDDAERECLRCVEQRPGDPNLLFLQAQICHRKGDAARAVALTEQVLRRMPRSRPALQLRAILYVEDNQPEKAIPLFREILAATREPNQVARYYLSLSLSQTGQAEEARKVQAEMAADEALKIWAERGNEPNPGLMLRAAESLLAVGKSEEAIRLVDKVLEQYPDCPAAHRLLAGYYEKHGQTARAVEHRRRADP